MKKLKGLLYKKGGKFIQKFQGGINGIPAIPKKKTALGGDIGLVNSDYISGQGQRVDKAGNQYTNNNSYVQGIDRTATTTGAAIGQKIATQSGINPIAAPVDTVGGGAPSLAITKSRQMNLQKAGLYDGEIDGIWGPKSEAAWQGHIRSSPELRKYWRVQD